MGWHCIRAERKYASNDYVSPHTILDCTAMTRGTLDCKQNITRKFQLIIQGRYRLALNRSIGCDLLICSKSYADLTCWSLCCSKMGKIIHSLPASSHGIWSILIQWKACFVIFWFICDLKFYDELNFHSRSVFIWNKFYSQNLAPSPLWIT